LLHVENVAQHRKAKSESSPIDTFVEATPTSTCSLLLAPVLSRHQNVKHPNEVMIDEQEKVSDDENLSFDNNEDNGRKKKGFISHSLWNMKQYFKF
jgi:hypothetical protein